MRKELLGRIIWVDCLFRSTYELLIEEVEKNGRDSALCHRYMALGHLEALFASSYLTADEWVEAKRSIEKIFWGEE